MTAQIPDILIHQGQQLALCAVPLEDYFEGRRRPPFHSPSTACWRGYQATWEIVDRKLYLIGLEGHLRRRRNPLKVVAADLRDVFPGSGAPIPATWVSGSLRCPEGRLLSYAHMGFASRYERDRIFEVREGVVIAEWLCLNPPEPVWYRLEEDGKRTRVEDPEPGAAVLDDPFPPDTMPLGHVFFGRPLPDEPEAGKDYRIGGFLTYPT